MELTRLSYEPVVRLNGILTHLIPREHDTESGGGKNTSSRQMISYVYREVLRHSDQLVVTHHICLQFEP